MFAAAANMAILRTIEAAVIIFAASTFAFAPTTLPAFSVAPQKCHRRANTVFTMTPTTTTLCAVQDPLSVSSALSSASTFLSTIDSDIANIPNDEFGKVFAGGIVVMFGGLFSALAVGAILDMGDNYGKVVADSYAQGGDEEFWSSLTPEQKEETERLLQKVKESKGGAADSGGSEDMATQSEGEVLVAHPVAEKKRSAETSMFSDYD